MRPRKFDEIAKDLEAKILNGSLKPGELIPSQSRLCELYSVSRSCAQKALEDLASKGLLESRPGKGVYVRGAQQLERPGRKFKNVAVVFHSGFRLESNTSDNFGLEMLWGVEEELRRQGANCIIRKRDANAGFDKIVPELESIEADAYIMDREFSDAQLKPLCAIGRPIAVLGRLSTLPFASCSLPNHGDCFLQAFARMADEGRKSVALLSAGLNYYDAELTWAVNRAAALYPSVKFSHIAMDCPLSSGAFKGVDGTMERLAGQGLPEVIVLSNDWYAVRVLEFLAKRGVKVPGEVSVIGCFGLAVGTRTSPPLSTMTMDAREIGRRAVRSLSASALEGARPSVEKVPFSLLERASFRWKNAQ